MRKTLLIASAWLFACNLHAYIDLNYNGLSDVYEFVYFKGSVDPSADPDGDGLSNYDEMFWGTIPTNAASNITGPFPTLNAATLQLTWPTALYRYYEVRASENLVAPTWHARTSGVISSYVENLAASNTPLRRFYRISVSFQPFTSFGIVPYEFSPSKMAGETDNVVTSSDGLDLWEEALYVQAFSVSPSAHDTDNDGLNDLQEFLQGRNPGQKDHPAVGLLVFTPLEH